jgi:arsenate reductase
LTPPGETAYRSSTMNDCCPPDPALPDPLPSGDEADQVVARLARGLAHPVRVRILRLLAASDRCQCGQIVAAFDLAQSTVSQHLKILREAGLVRGEIEGPATCYCLSEAGLALLRRLLDGLDDESRTAGPRARPRSILVLCTGNSARSQMAQCLLGRHLGDGVEVYSAGTEPAERIHPLTIEVLEEVGFDLEGRVPIDCREYLGSLDVHTLITVCEAAAKSCPAVWPGVYERLQWPFEDPAAFVGTEAEQLARFREIRDAIDARARQYARSHTG